MRQGTIFDIKKFAIHDGPGIRTTVFFKGCPLGCQWCHNPESRSTEPEYFEVAINRNSDNPTIKKEKFGYKISVDQLFEEIKKDAVFYDESGGGVTFSGGEPMYQLEFLNEMLQKCRSGFIPTAVDTTGYVEYDKFETVYDQVDIFLYDLKIVDDDAHLKYTGVSNQLIIENLKKLTERGEKVWLRLPLIPDITDTDKNMGDSLTLARSLKHINQISLLPYNLLGEDKHHKFNLPLELSGLKTQSKEKLDQIARPFIDAGFEVTIGG